MRKLKLAIEALAVETFQTSAAAGSRGTVLGASETDEPQPATEPGGPCIVSHTCDYTMAAFVTACEDCEYVLETLEPCPA